MIRHPISFSLTPPRHDLPPPALGQDNEQIRAWLSQTPGSDPETREPFQFQSPQAD
jgi:crotonobetainyl-CoA:carnitine CoA-transferase CaiB-like acyl-CoA transferase